MDSNYFQALMGYKASMAQAKIMLSKGLITAEEYSVIETKMCDIFGINSDSLFRCFWYNKNRAFRNLKIPA